MPDYKNCPVRQEAERVLYTIEELEKFFRKLGKYTRRCYKCESRSECPFMQKIQSDIDRALIDTWKEWEHEVIEYT